MENPIELKAVCTFIENGTSNPPSIISSSYRYTLPSNKRHPTSKRKVTGPSVLHEKKRLYDGSRLNCFLVCSCLPVLSCCFYFMCEAPANVKVTALNLVATWQK